MTSLVNIFNNFKSQLIADLTQEVSARGGRINLHILIGGRESNSLPVQTWLEKVYIQPDLFNGETLMVSCTEKVSKHHIDKPMHEYNISAIEDICLAVEVERIGKEVTDGRG